MSTVAEMPEARVVDREQIASLHRRIAAKPRVESEVTIRKTPGLITRQILMVRGSEHLSKVHNSEHQFIISQGAALVSENGGPTVLMIAPYHGITKPGTWRHLLIVMDMLWTTMHATSAETIDELEKQIITPTEVAS